MILFFIWFASDIATCMYDIGLDRLQLKTGAPGIERTLKSAGFRGASE